MTGALCDRCEDAIEGMTQAQLDADFEKHHAERNGDHFADLRAAVEDR